MKNKILYVILASGYILLSNTFVFYNSNTYNYKLNRIKSNNVNNYKMRFMGDINRRNILE